MTESLIARLQLWYENQCNGDWEHQYGVRVATLDNPGWQVTVDLAETALAGRQLSPVDTDRSESDWVHCSIRDGKYEGFGGPGNLGEVLEVFLSWSAANKGI